METNQAHQSMTGGTGTFRGGQLFRREGDFWVIHYDGMICRLRDSRGLRHLHLLLTNPHEQIAALSIEWLGGEHDDLAGRGPVALHDARERARVNVTRAIAVALKHIDSHHPTLGKHLAATVRTGTFCTYTPNPRIPICWTE